MAQDFTGFPNETLVFLRALQRNNNRDWFHENRDRYEAAFLEPSLRFIEAMAGPLRAIAPCLTAVARKSGGSLMRIYRDTRFAKDKSPYKTNIGIQFRHEAGATVHAPGFYVHVEPGQVFLGAGVWHPESEALKQIRQAIADDPARWKRASDNNAFRAAFELEGECLKRPPAGIDKEHPMIEDLKRKDFIGVCRLEDSAIEQRDFVTAVAKKFKATVPFTRFLCKALGIPF